MARESITRSVADNFLADFLKEHGFSRRGFVWNRRRGEFVDVVVLQKAKFSSPALETVTVDFAIAVPEFRRLIFGSCPKILIEADGVLTCRMTELLQDVPHDKVRDVWWKLDSENREVIAAEILRAVMAHLSPFFDRHQTFSDLRRAQEVVRGGSAKLPYFLLNRALVCWKLGDMACAEECLTKAAAWPEQAARVRAQISAEQA